MRRLVCSLTFMVMLCGCWDRTMISEKNFVDVIGLDTAENPESIKMSVAISSLDEAHQGGGRPGMQVLSHEGYSVANAIENLDNELAGEITFKQSRLYILSKSFAKEKPEDGLKVLGRVATSPLNASVAVYDGEVSKLLARPKMTGKTTANYLEVLVDEAETIGFLPRVTLLRYIISKQDPYEDMALPLFKMREDHVQLDGAALFDDGRYTGIDLPLSFTRIAMLLKDAKKTNFYITTQINGSSYQVWIKKIKRDFVIKTKDNKINEIILPLSMQVFLTDSGKNKKALSQEKLDDIEKMVTEELNMQAIQTIQTLQSANCDFLGIAREIHGYHFKEWSQMNWREAYPKLQIRPEVKIQILNSGVML